MKSAMPIFRNLLLFSLLLGGLLYVLPAGAVPPHKRLAKPASMKSPRFARLEANPASISLTGPLATQHLLVTAFMTDGTRRDVTDEASFSAVQTKVIAV